MSVNIQQIMPSKLKMVDLFRIRMEQRIKARNNPLSKSASLMAMHPLIVINKLFRSGTPAPALRFFSGLQS
jgi:hypothetical protein